MVSVTDNIGRPLYSLDTQTNERFHPYTGEPVEPDFEYNYENGRDMTISEIVRFWVLTVVLVGLVTLMIYKVWQWW